MNTQGLATFKPPPTGEWRRLLLWIFWTFNMLINLCYVCISFATSSRLVQNYAGLASAFDNTAWRAPIAACVLGGIMVLMFNAMSCAVLIRKSINKSGPGFGYGFIMGWCFVMAFFTFLCGLVLDSFGDVIKSQLEDEKWKSYWTSAYYGTIALAFICSAFYLIFFLTMVIFQGGISKTIGLYDVNTDTKRRMEGGVQMNTLAMQAGTSI
eukprot:CAMPEP_0119108960 /NCGR_PEP_ID=MMETSP1180-20130426/16460_1 /TAXON_ID=3052 ORGANISM="Chlamydomonas cf sp, Strain CCMP681" /NCGR_SAMPLE_ID=MMETSP1180 /ASSEMBLY_ACC=CAM_ASM_000741 /LENGTH=209 /DNA_ID=CAMNT_0007094647 /DNA_START=160 /DNA_END=789 /DNA_ORIENTATION=-